MKEHAINNIRGGTYSELKLPDYKIKTLKSELASVSGSCFGVEGIPTMPKIVKITAFPDILYI